MPTVCILGAGDVGGAAAQALARRGAASRIVLIDPAAAVAAGKALDLRQAGAITGTDVALTGSGDWSRLTGSAACIVADRHGRPPWTADGDATRLLADRLSAFAGDAPVVVADAMSAGHLLGTMHAQGLPRARLIGSAPHALKHAVAAMVALEAGCAPGDVMLTVLGAPPDGFVVPWSDASIGGHPLDRLLTAAQLARLESRAARLWPPGPATLGHAAAIVVEAILGGSRQTCCVSTILDGEFGVRNRVGIVAARFDRRGIAHIRQPILNPRERVRVEVALGG